MTCLTWLLCASASLAQEIPNQESFKVTIKQNGSWEGFPVAHKYWVWIAQREGVFEGTGLLDGMTSRCISNGTTVHGVSTAEIHCENTDSDGDKVFEASKEECACAPGGNGGKGYGEFIGGTGKYTGVRGSFEIERKVGARNQDARTWTDHVTIEGRLTLP